jgi:hydroxymethylglutaryl-CoA synthase
MDLDAKFGIVGYGVYIPRYRVALCDIAAHRAAGGAKIPEGALKSVAGPDEDAATMGIEAAQNALRRGGVEAAELRAIYFGSESKPYAVKPSAVTVASALGCSPALSVADLEFACKAGTEAFRCAGLHAAAKGGLALALASDTAQARPGDELEFTAAAGAAAYVLGPADKSLALLEADASWATDTPDFFRRSRGQYPVHGHRFTGQPGYFAHTVACARNLLSKLGVAPEGFQHAVFHQPNRRFPREVGKLLGFSDAQMAAGMVGDRIGNTYAASSLLGLAAVLDIARAGERIFCVSYGSGAGADGFAFRVTEHIETTRAHGSRPVAAYLARNTTVDYATYLEFTDALRGH